MSGNTRSRRALASALVVLAIAFLALAWWQVERRTWKLDLIERVNERVHAPAVAAPSADSWGSFKGADQEYRHVKAEGTYAAVPDTLVQAVTEIGAGFWVISPLRLNDGNIVMINRGYVPQGTRPEAAPRAHPVQIFGLLRLTEPRGGFLRKNDPAGERWYSRDTQAIGASRGLSGVAPFFIDEEAAGGKVRPSGSVADSVPVAGLTVIAFHNSHLVYAITWCTLALMALMAARYVIRRDGIDAGDKSAAED